MSEAELDKQHIITLLQEEDDFALIKFIQEDKNYDAYIALFLKYAGFLRKIIVDIVKNPDDIEDVFQDLYLKAIKWKKFYRLKSVGVFIEMAKNVSITFYNKQQKHRIFTNIQYKADSVYNENHDEIMDSDAYNIEDVIYDIIKEIISNDNNKICTKSEMKKCKEAFESLNGEDIEKLKHIFKSLTINCQNFTANGINMVNKITVCFFKQGLENFRAYYDKYVNSYKYKDLITKYFSKDHTSEATLRQRLCRMNKEIGKIVSKLNGGCDET